jgi:uncharacterized membrane protein
MHATEHDSAAMKRLAVQLRSRPLLVGTTVVGIVVAALLPPAMRGVTRALVGWNAAVWLYLVLTGSAMLRADHERLRRTALAHAEGAATVSAMVVVGAVASLVGIVMELSAAKGAGASQALPHVLLALSTIASAWLLVPTVFALTYASAFYVHSDGKGLQFPDRDPAFRPHYGDFLYFAFTIAVACQTADVAVANPAMRRLVLLQALASFVFKTAILALAINIAASTF